MKKKNYQKDVKSFVKALLKCPPNVCNDEIPLLSTLLPNLDTTHLTVYPETKNKPQGKNKIFCSRRP